MFKPFFVVAGAGFEPTTFGLWARRATELLYPAIYSVLFLYSIFSISLLQRFVKQYFVFNGYLWSIYKNICVFGVIIPAFLVENKQFGGTLPSQLLQSDYNIPTKIEMLCTALKAKTSALICTIYKYYKCCIFML